jgi:hypothetical protein
VRIAALIIAARRSERQPAAPEPSNITGASAPCQHHDAENNAPLGGQQQDAPAAITPAR